MNSIVSWTYFSEHLAFSADVTVGEGFKARHEPRIYVQLTGCMVYVISEHTLNHVAHQVLGITPDVEELQTGILHK